MKKYDVIWRGINTAIILAILVIACLILKKVNRCCDCEEKPVKVVVKSLNLGLKTTEFYDSINHKKCIGAYIDTLPEGQHGESYVLMCNDCPEKETKKVSVAPKKSSVIKKVKETALKVEVKEEPVKRDSCHLRKADISHLALQISPVISVLKVELWKTEKGDTSLLYSQTSTISASDSVLTDEKIYNTETKNFSMSSSLLNKTKANFNLVPDLHIKEHIYPAKTHLIIGATAAAAGAITFSSTMFSEIPTFVQYNGLDPFDPANKYYDRNMLERTHLRTLKTVRAVGIGIGLLGGLEIINGIHLLKNAEVSLTPQGITLKTQILPSSNKK